MAKAVRADFDEGNIPDPDTVCEVDAEMFSGSEGWEGLLPELLPN